MAYHHIPICHTFGSLLLLNLGIVSLDGCLYHIYSYTNPCFVYILSPKNNSRKLYFYAWTACTPGIYASTSWLTPYTTAISRMPTYYIGDYVPVHVIQIEYYAVSSYDGIFSFFCG